MRTVVSVVPCVLVANAVCPRRVVVVSPATLVVSFGVFGAVLGQPKFVCRTDTVKVAHGDTLWAIAERECDGEISFVVHHLVGVYGTTIHAGDAIDLPSDYADTKGGDK